jgi:hypothetical protein
MIHKQEKLVKNYIVTDSNGVAIYTTTEQSDAERELKKMRHIEGDYFHIETAWLNPL